MPSNRVNGTNPNEAIHVRQRLSCRNTISTIEDAISMLMTLVECDEFHNMATIQNIDELYAQTTDLPEKLCTIGDSTVFKVVQWAKRQPFYLELPMDVYPILLTNKWQELVVLTTCTFQALYKVGAAGSHGAAVDEAEFNQEVDSNFYTLQNCLSSLIGREITMEQLREDVGLLMERITRISIMLRQIKLTMEEYVCLKVILMLDRNRPNGSGPTDMEMIHERYMTCLRIYIQHKYPEQPTRLQDLLNKLPEGLKDTFYFLLYGIKVGTSVPEVQKGIFCNVQSENIVRARERLLEFLKVLCTKGIPPRHAPYLNPENNLQDPICRSASLRE